MFQDDKTKALAWWYLSSVHLPGFPKLSSQLSDLSIDDLESETDDEEDDEDADDDW